MDVLLDVSYLQKVTDYEIELKKMEVRREEVLRLAKERYLAAETAIKILKEIDTEREEKKGFIDEFYRKYENLRNS